MIDREKVIKGLECCIKDGACYYTEKCPYYNEKQGCKYVLNCDALALLKAQEPRVMTPDEALNSLVIEYRSGKLQEVGKRVFTEGFEYYGIVWRVWDRMPTDEQKEKVKWDS